MSATERHTYKQAVGEIRSKRKEASLDAVHIYSFNIPSEQLEKAYALLDKQEGRKAMRVSFSDANNFIVKYMPGPAHQGASTLWTLLIWSELRSLLPQPQPANIPGCMALGGTTYQLGAFHMEADAAIGTNQAIEPSIVLEVGCSQNLPQLRSNAEHWIARMNQVQLVVLLSISRPPAGQPNSTPVIKIELWRAVPPPQDIGNQARHGGKVWEADWTNGATPLYLLLADIFRGAVPADYGAHTRVFLDTVSWCQAILTDWQFV